MNRRHRNALPPGYRLHWYEIDSILGQGGFGITYLARDTNLDQLVAIKEFLPQELAVRDSDSSVHPVTEGHQDTFGWGLSRFLTEAQTLAKFRHPNIVLVHSVFEANNTAYMVMQYERGRSLDDALKFRKIQGEAAVKALTWPLLDGLELLHEAGFIHRDIKPQNVYIRDDGTPVLLDFGSARLALGGATRTLTTLVSPGYAPFEQYEASSEGGRQGPWTDIYSLGATLYLAVTGQGPPDAVKRAHARLDGKADPLLHSGALAPPGYSPGFLYAIDSALAFQAAERPKSIAQWRAMLQAAEPDEQDFDATVMRAPPAAAEEPLPTMRAVDDDDLPPTRRRAPAPVPRSRAPLVVVLSLAVLGAAAAGAWYAGLLPPGLLPGAATPPPPVAEVSPPRLPGSPPAEVMPDRVVETPAAAPVEQASAPPATAAEADDPAAAPPAEADVATDTAAVRESQQLAALAEQQRLEEAALVEAERRAAAEAARLVEEVERAAAEAARRQALEEAARREAETVRLSALMAAAREDLEAGRLVEPAGGNALARYREVLQAEPGNEAARAGVAAVLAALVARAREALESGRLDDAEASLREAEAIDAADPEVRSARSLHSVAAAAVAAMRAEDRAAREAEAERQRLAAEAASRQAEAEAQARREAEAAARRQVELERQRAEKAEAAARRQAELERQRAEQEEAARQAELAREEAARADQQQRVEELLAQAQQHIDELRMTGPPGFNALENLREVLRLQPGNERAQAGIDRIVDFYIDVAGRAVRSGEPERAPGFLDRAWDAAPGSPLVVRARQRLAAGEGNLFAPEPGAQLAAAAPAPEPEPELAAPALPRLAYIGPLCARCDAKEDSQLASFEGGLRRALQRASQSVALHSASWPGAPRGPIATAADFGRFWSGPRSFGAQPRAREMAQVARQSDADGLLFALLADNGPRDYKLRVFLLDADSGRLLHADGVTTDTTPIASAVLARWATLRGVARPKPSAPGRDLRLAVLGQWCVRCGASWRTELDTAASETRKAVERLIGIEVQSSPWSDTRRPPARPDDEARFWQRPFSLTTVEPRPLEFAQVGRQAGVDGLLVTAVGAGAGNTYESRVFLINAGDGQVIEARGNVWDTDELVQRVLEQWRSRAYAAPAQ